MKPLSVFVTHCGIVKLNPLVPSDPMWHRTESALAQVMAWCLTALSHYLNMWCCLNQCWLIVIGAVWHSTKPTNWPRIWTISLAVFKILIIMYVWTLDYMFEIVATSSSGINWSYNYLFRISFVVISTMPSPKPVLTCDQQGTRNISNKSMTMYVLS